MESEERANLEQARKYRLQVAEYEACSEIIRESVSEDVRILEEIDRIGDGNVPRGTCLVSTKSILTRHVKVKINLEGDGYDPLVLPVSFEGEKHGVRWEARLNLTRSTDSELWYDVEERSCDAHELLASGAEIITQEPKLEKAFVSRPSLAAKRHNPDEISVLRLSKDYGEWLITPMLAKQFLDVYGVAIDPGSGDVYMLEQATTIGKKYICRKGT